MKKTITVTMDHAGIAPAQKVQPDLHQRRKIQMQVTAVACPRNQKYTLLQWISHLIFEVYFCVLNYCRVHWRFCTFTDLAVQLPNSPINIVTGLQSWMCVLSSWVPSGTAPQLMLRKGWEHNRICYRLDRPNPSWSCLQGCIEQHQIRDHDGVLYSPLCPNSIHT
mgnify:CR=1 FL=1